MNVLTTADPQLSARPDQHRRRRIAAAALAVWAFAYGCYRAYYALGGQAGMIGHFKSAAEWHAINAAGAVILFVAAGLPLVAVANRRHAWVRRLLPVVCWVGAVGCCMHALVSGTLRVLSLTGVHAQSYPAGLWLSIDRHAADLQDLLFNEPWFFIEGCLWAVLGLACIGAVAHRRWWRSAVVACLVLVAVGVLSGLGVIGTVRIL